ncbi:protein TIFY 4B-like isoform X2 [Hibiscus syriacus]|uniref:protein TIFY 4B-like isoform X2 n=1 Tax=Hibiscus syriacus TaxID=106335 RepID=UPI001922B74E|nr:protein TIFY 4B-like isoform X2 [Hibiscus syriacus]
MEAVVRTEATTTVSFSSILNKPLIQLTEEDISQLTREDCRKFLKEKGMRRPSWNKSQAIQQVISLKALLENNEDSTACALRKIVLCPPPPPVPPQNVVAHDLASNSGNSAKEIVVGEEGPLKTAPVVEMSCQGGEKDKKIRSPRNQCETNELGGQMTIFYCGKIDVYDGVPLAKAHEIMHLAASPIDFTRDNADLRSFIGHVQEAGDKNNLVASTALNSHTIQTGKMIEYQQQFREKGNISRDSDGQMNRKVSLQRYLEKRKDRGRFFKGRKHAGQTSSSFEMHLSQLIGTHYSNEQSSRSGTSSPPQSTVPHAFCSSSDNQAKLVNLSVDLNDESGKEHRVKCAFYASSY